MNRAAQILGTRLACAIVVLLFLGLGACGKRPDTQEKSCLDRFSDVAVLPLGRSDVEKAIAVANLVLEETSLYRLRPGWISEPPSQPTRGKSRDVVVHTIAVDPSGKYSIAFVPQGSGCILVDTSVASVAFDRLVGGRSVRGEQFPQEYVIAHVLLHELGHVVNPLLTVAPADRDPVDKLCKLAGLHRGGPSSSPLNTDCTADKANEIAADQFAAEQEKLAIQSRTYARREASGMVQITLAAMGIRIIVDRAERNKSRNPGRDVFCDAGFSHPNFELRLLFTVQLLHPESQWSLANVLRDREKCLGKEDTTAKDDPRDALAKMSNRDLVQRLGNASGEELNDLITVIGDRKGDEVVAAMVGLARTPDPADEKTRVELRTTRASAIDALGRIGDRRVGSLLIEKLRGSVLAEQMAAASALGELRDPANVAPMIAAANAQEQFAFFGIVDALGEIGSPSALDFLAQVERANLAGSGVRAMRAMDRIRATSAAAAASSQMMPSQGRR